MAKNDFKELGASGLARYSGVVQEEFLTELRGPRWFRTIRQMAENDATLNGLSYAIEMLARQAEWDFSAADESQEAQEVKEFFESVLFDDLDVTWPDLLSELLGFLKWGFSLQEIVLKVRGGDVVNPLYRSRFNDGRIGIRKLLPLAQESLDRWEFSETGEAIAFIQRPEPDFIERTIPLEKCLHLRASVRKGNPEGRSIYRGAYTSWYFKTNISRIEGIGIERDLAGLPVGKLPSEYFSAAATSDQLAIFEEYKKIITNVRMDEQMGVLIPSDRDANGNALFELALMSTGGSRAFDTDKIITRYDQRMTLVVLADFILLGQTAKSGSYGMNESKSHLFTVAMNSFLDTIAAEINRKLVPKLGKVNGIPEALWPKLEHDGVDQVDLGTLGDYVSKLSGAAVIFTQEQGAYLKKMAGIPVTDAEENGELEMPNNAQQPAQEDVPTPDPLPDDSQADD